MAVLISNTSTGSGNPSASSGVVTMSVNRASGEGLLLGIFYEYQWGAPDAISSVVWDAAGDNQAFTHVLTNQLKEEHKYLAIYYLAAPSSVKTANITITFAGSTNDNWAGMCRHITGHDTSAMISTSAQRDESAPGTNDLPITIASAVGELVVAFCGIRIETPFLSAGDASDYQELVTAFSSRSIISGSKAGASSVTITFGFDDTGFQANALGAVSIAPSGGGSETITLTPAPASVQVGSARTFTATRSAPAGAGGVTYNVSSDNPAVATVPTPQSLTEADSDLTFDATGVSVGTANITITNAADSSETDTVALTVTAVTTKRAKFLVHPDFASATGITIEVNEAPTGGALTGAKLGFATGIAAESTLEGGQAVIKVNAADVGASALAAGTSVRAIFKGLAASGSALGSGAEAGSVVVATGTIIEE